MYKWLKRYVEQFEEDFPVTAVADKNEYEICHIIKECCEAGKKYVIPTIPPTVPA